MPVLSGGRLGTVFCEGPQVMIVALELMKRERKCGGKRVLNGEVGFRSGMYG